MKPFGLCYPISGYAIERVVMIGGVLINKSSPETLKVFVKLIAILVMSENLPITNVPGSLLHSTKNLPRVSSICPLVGLRCLAGRIESSRMNQFCHE
jgi:hypothetical protein